MFGACKDSESTKGYEGCEDNDACEGDLVCEDGECVEEDPGTGPSKKDPKEPPAKEDRAKYTEACDEDEDCEKDLSCINTAEGSICTRICPQNGGNEVCEDDDAELDMECLSLRPTGDDLVWMCYPRAQTYCKPCTPEDADDLTADCGTIGADFCLSQDDGDYCAVDCSDGKSCPDGAFCDTVNIDGDEYAVCVPEDGRCEKCVDADNDGYGDPNYDMSECTYPDIPDCDDSRNDVYPGAPTSCDGLDNDCSGRVDNDYRDENGVYERYEHCGACGNNCGALDNVKEAQCAVEETNEDTTCEILECEDGWADCDGDPTNGCETDLSDPQSCGACDVKCGGSSSTTAVSECVLIEAQDEDEDDTYACDIQCEDGYDDCDGDPSNGCEVDLNSNSNCGTCGTDCRNLYENADGVCSDHECKMDACEEGFEDCDGDDANGCEADLSSLDTCGSCDITCGSDNAYAQLTECVEGASPDQNTCLIECRSGFDNCDGIPNNGCETNLANDADHCGVCGASCGIANADSSCVNSICAFDGCDEDYGDCDGDMGTLGSLFNPGSKNGCEANLINNDEHCGTCGNDCTTMNGDWVCDVDACFANACAGDELTCPDDATQCASNRNDPETCGGCNTNCLDVPHVADADCSPDSSDRCAITECDAGYADCDGSHSNGCEVNTETDTAHCGACGQACDDLVNAVQECQNGSCAFVECESGWLDLDGAPEINGCPYECTPEPGDDRPGDITDSSYSVTHQDTNCDGIDGDINRALFVDRSSGNDNNPGTKEQPLQSITAALTEIATLNDKDQIYVSRGTYNESILLIEGVSIYGGYDASQNWKRSAAYEVTIRNTAADSNTKDVVGLYGDNIGTDGVTELQNVRVVAGSASERVPGTKNGASSIGLHCTNCEGLVIRGAVIEAQNGYAGAGGSSGSQQFPSVSSLPSSCKDQHGQNGSAASGGDRGSGGESFECSLTNETTRAGGQAGHGRSTSSGDSGSSGQVAGSGGGSGGGGGSSNANPFSGSGGPGGPGGKGDDGTPGTVGNAGGFTFTCTAGICRFGAEGTDGGDGSMGHGGGGGGGGGNNVLNGGGGGGGGGASGCPGTKGTGSGAGGNSIAALLVDSSGIAIETTTFITGTGGNAGAAGKGGAEGPGCPGGNGGSGAGQAGNGGKGGAGGAGGRGGHGGGGTGGSSVGILLSNTNVTPSSPVWTLGNAGAGGQSDGNAGPAGKKENTYTVP